MREEILALVAERSGMVFAPYRRLEAEAGIARAMKHAGADDLAAYLILVRRDGTALDDLVDELRVGETHFMRDPDQIDLVRREVLPALACSITPSATRSAEERSPRIAPSVFSRSSRRLWSVLARSGDRARRL